MSRLFIELYLDEDVDVLIAQLIRARGFAVVTTQETGQLQNSDAEQYCPSGNTCTDQKGVTLTEEASDAAVVSNIAFGVGAVALISGAYLFLTGAPEKRSGIRVAPMVSHNGGVITASGAFE